MTLGITQSLREMSTRRYFWGKPRLVRKADKLTAISERTVGSSTSHNPIGLHGLLQGQLCSVRHLCMFTWIVCYGTMQGEGYGRGALDACQSPLSQNGTQPADTDEATNVAFRVIGSSDLQASQ
jgi:hypothetical protein